MDRRTFISATAALAVPTFAYAESSKRISLAIKYKDEKAPSVCNLQDLRKGDVFRLDRESESTRHICVDDPEWIESSECWGVIIAGDGPLRTRN